MSFFKPALTNTFPCLPTTCINHIGWHHATLHCPYSSLYELCIGAIGFLFDSWPLKMGLTGCPTMSVINYHYSLSNNPEEHSSHLLRGRSLKSRTVHLSGFHYIWIVQCVLILWNCCTVLAFTILIKFLPYKTWYWVQPHAKPIPIINPCRLYRLFFLQGKNGMGRVLTWFDRQKYPYPAGNRCSVI